MKKVLLVALLFMVPVAANAGIIRTSYKVTKKAVKTAVKTIEKTAKIAYKVAY